MTTPEELAALHAQCFQLPPPWRAADFAPFLADSACFLCQRSESGGLRAFALFRVAADEAELLTLATAPDARRKGLARALLQEGLHMAQLRGARVCFLEVAAPNMAAQALYESLGFQRQGGRKGYYRAGGQVADALVFRAELAA
ncbi:MAG: GNAT family N-acetyltransferase [Roseinatronobacter sp.]|nr:GNAT family N-acetyltransferase [Roseinatronobacter sp.]